MATSKYCTCQKIQKQICIIWKSWAQHNSDYSKSNGRLRNGEVVLTVDVFPSDIQGVFTKIKFYQHIFQRYSENEYYDKSSDEDFLFE